MNADGSGQRLLARNGAHPLWSPDGRTIAFVRRQANRGLDLDIYVVNAEGGPARNLTRTPAYENDPAWSPDGRRIAFTRRYDIWLMNADGSGKRRLTSGTARDRAPSWSPDGRTIAFDRRAASAAPEIAARTDTDLRDLRHERRRQRIATAGAKRRADQRAPALVVGREEDRLLETRWQWAGVPYATTGTSSS